MKKQILNEVVHGLRKLVVFIDDGNTYQVQNRLSVSFTIEKCYNGNEFDLEIIGDIKWDGCCNWMCEGDKYNHICDYNEFDEIALLMKYAYLYASEYFGSDFFEVEKDLPKLVPSIMLMEEIFERID